MTRSGFAAIIGAPNAGKSTLVNRLVGSKVSIVTRKVQTTRFAVRGIAMEGESQIVLVDTPGIFAPRRRLDRAMVNAAWKGAGEADAIVQVIDAEAHDCATSKSGDSADRLAVRDTLAIRDELSAVGRRAILAVNKIDRVRKERLLRVVDEMFVEGVYDEAYLISASDGSGVADLKHRLADLMPPGPWLYSPDASADLPMRVLAAEITREKLYDRVHEELPYSSSVETTAYVEQPNGSVRIEQTIFVEREGQRAILIGKNGSTLKWIGKAAREELSKLIGRPAHLFLHVKVKARWSDDPELFRSLGLEYDV